MGQISENLQNRLVFLFTNCRNWSIIKKYVDENKIAPTVREICNLSGLKSTSTVYGYLTRLEEEGYIKKKDNSPRSIVLYETDGE